MFVCLFTGIFAAFMINCVLMYVKLYVDNYVIQHINHRQRVPLCCREKNPSPANSSTATNTIAMVGTREGARLARALSTRQLPLHTSSACARRFASTKTTKAKSSDSKSWATEDLETTSSFATPAPDAKIIEKFEAGQGVRTKEDQLPGNRYV